jgi:hypothetical protein
VGSSIVFYPGLHQPADARHFSRACISINRLRGRKKRVDCYDLIIDSGAFTELSTHGHYRHTVDVYAAELIRLQTEGVTRPTVAVAQDYMCEPFILKKTGLTVREHQERTVARYVRLVECQPLVPVMPVLQGFAPLDYVRHLEDYGGLLTPGMWVGVGSVCKRNGSPVDIVNVLSAIRHERPDLKLHGFGLKKTALMNPSVRAMLHTADSMAWSFHARINGRSGNDWREAKAFTDQVENVTASAETQWQGTFAF